MDDPEEISNPWQVPSLDEFLYYCCPECDMKTKEHILFFEHAVKIHEQAKDVLCSSEGENVFTKCEFKVEETDITSSDDETELIEAVGKALECADCDRSFESNADYKKHYYAVHLKEQNQDPLATGPKRKAIEPLLEMTEKDLSKKMCKNVQCIDCLKVIHPSLLERHKKVCPNQKGQKETETEEFISDGQIKIEIDEEMKDSPNIFIHENIEVKESLETSKTLIDERKTQAQKKPVIKIEDLEDKSEVKR